MAKNIVKSKVNWENIKKRLIQLFGGLFMERKGDIWAISVGRVSWWLAFTPALQIWILKGGAQDIASNHLTILLILAGYNFGKKVVDKFSQKNDGPG